MDTEYEYWCVNENDWIREWTNIAPVVCKNNALHTITAVSAKRELEPNNREIITYEQNFKKAGTIDFFTESISLYAESGENEKIVSWPFDINVYEITMFPYSTNIAEDYVSTIINPGYTAGTTTSNIDSGTNVLPVSTTVLMYVRKPGWYVITITDGVNSEILGRVIGRDTSTNTLTTEYNITNSYSSGSYIKVDYYMMYNFELFTTTTGLQTGISKFGGTLIPKNVPVKIIYTNVTGIPKRFIAKLEYCW